MWNLWRKFKAYYFLSEEEMGKKDDDHVPDHNGLHARPAAQWSPARGPQRRAVRRVILWALLVAVLYYLFNNLPSGFDFRERGPRLPPLSYPRDPRAKSYVEPVEPAHPVPATGRIPEAGATDSTGAAAAVGGAGSTGNGRKAPTQAAHTYNGPVRFYNLAKTLRSMASATGGGTLINKNVLFAASSLRSAAALLPLACEMGIELRSYVNFALISRSDIEIEELRKINGIDDSCQIFFHDARPDYSTISTDARLAHAVSRAMYHININLHPQAILVDASEFEEVAFLRGMRQHAFELKATVIELPGNTGKKFSWIAKLDSSSLAAWNKVNVDILIHAPPTGSGSFIRLLRSLGAADLSPFSAPHLTIELPQRIEKATEYYLKTFQWPPVSQNARTSPRTNMLSLRHRIPTKRMNEDESSIRFLESFWPTDPGYSHILVLTPQSEVSPQFFHYLKYSLLHYRYSSTALLQQWDKRLLGISVDLPSSYLNATAAFTPPRKQDAPKLQPLEATDETSFLWQAPNSNAILFMGEKWVEMHGFVSQTLQVQQEVKPVPSMLADKDVSRKYPSWLEHALRLSRARGYFTLYPCRETASMVATVHHELYQRPEEYETTSRGGRDPLKDHEDVDVSLPAFSALLDTLPYGGILKPFKELPLLSWDGELTSLPEMDAWSRKYAIKFRKEVGGCNAKEAERTRVDPFGQDLFCERKTPKT